MARHFPTGGQDYGPIAFDAAGATPTKMYLYAERFGVFAGKQQLFGLKNWPDGALEEGPLSKELKTVTNKPDFSSLALAVETEGPYIGDLVVTFDMGV